MFVRARPEGLWIQGSVVDPLEFEGLDRDRARSLDGKGGGSYTLEGALILGGEGVELAGANHKVSGTLTVLALAQVTVANGAEIKADGSAGDIRLRVVSNVARLEAETGTVIQVKAGGALDIHGGLTLKNASGPGSMTAENGTSITMQAGSTMTVAGPDSPTAAAVLQVSGDLNIKSGGDMHVESGGDLYLDSGAFAQLSGTVDSAGNFTFIGDTWPKLNSRSWERHTLLVAFCTFANHTGDGPDSPDIWAASSDVSSSQCLRTRAADATGDYSVVEFKDLPAGGVLSNVKVKSKGIENVVPTYPTYRIVRWLEGDDFEYVSNAVTDIHSTDGNWHTVVRTTTLTPSSAHTIDSKYRYGVRVTHPYPAAGSASMRIYDVGAYGTLQELRNT